MNQKSLQIYRFINSFFLLDNIFVHFLHDIDKREVFKDFFY